MFMLEMSRSTTHLKMKKGKMRFLKDNVLL